MNDCQIYLQVDEIDHVTHAYKQGKPLDVPHAVKLIRQYTAENDEVAAMTAKINPIFTNIEVLPADELVQNLVAIRTILLKSVWPNR